jgi:putative MFS transporter
MSSISDRLDRLPITSTHRWVTTIFAFAYFFELSDLHGTFSFAAPALVKAWGIHMSSIAFIASAAGGGMLVGSTVGGLLADKIGRKYTFIASLALYTITSLLNAFAWNVPSLAVFRLATGTGLSAMTVIANTYISEFFPARVRGKMLAKIVAFGLLGIPVTGWVARWLVTLGPNGWRFIFVWGSLGVIAAPIAWLKLKESPRWLATHGMAKGAEAIVAQMEQTAIAEHGELPPLVPVPQSEKPARISYGQIFGSKYRRRTIVLFASSICSTLGIFGFLTWVPTLLVHRGFSIVTSLGYSSLIITFNPIGAALGTLLIERMERKYYIAAVGWVLSLAALCYGLAFSPLFIIVFGATVAMGVQMYTVGQWTYQTENFPTEVRSGAIGFLYGAGRIASMVCPFIVSALYNFAGYYSVFFYIAGCYFLGGTIVALFGPKSTGYSLESV